MAERQPQCKNCGGFIEFDQKAKTWLHSSPKRWNCKPWEDNSPHVEPPDDLALCHTEGVDR